MTKKKTGVGKNRHSPAKVRAFQKELDEWMGRNNLLEDTQWRTADKHFGPSHLSFPCPHYLVLIAESDLHDVLWGYSPPEMSDADGARLQQEFYEILKRHGLHGLVTA